MKEPTSYELSLFLEMDEKLINEVLEANATVDSLDKILSVENDNLTYEFTISGICQNYIGDYVYMTKQTYTKNIVKYSINTQYLKFKEKYTFLPKNSYEHLVCCCFNFSSCIRLSIYNRSLLCGL